jgi:hypothetical protein
MLRRLILTLAALAGAGYAGYRFVVAPWWRSWGVVPEEAGRPLPGDELIDTIGASETRGLTIAATPAEIWPWLLQMGYGRAGWYSYDVVDMAGSSSDAILPELQDLKVGDVVPTHPGGGFLVKILEPERALVLYSDTELVEKQAAAAREAGEEAAAPNVKATGALLENAQPTEFRASWAFVLEPLPGGQTRLVERFRVFFGASDKPWTRYTLPMMGFGVFVMVRRQLLGIRERAERAAGARSDVARVRATPAAADGPTAD